MCDSDYHYVEGTRTVVTPAVLGHEGAGIVEKIGQQVTNVKPGDHVILSGVLACGLCDNCSRGRPVLCINRAAAGRSKNAPPRLSQGGRPLHQFVDLATFAEQMLVHESAALKVPDDVPLDRVALIGCGVTTGLGAALLTARVEPGSRVAVFGCGGVGISAIQGASIAGARQIIAVDRFESKLMMAQHFGATDTVDASSQDPVAAVRKLSGGLGVDYSFEAVGIKKLAEQCFNCLAPGGTATIIGAMPDGTKIEVDEKMLLRECRLQGCAGGSVRPRLDIPRFIDYYIQGRLNLDDMISRRARLEDVNEAFAAMDGGQVARTVLMFN